MPLSSVKRNTDYRLAERQLGYAWISGAELFLLGLAFARRHCFFSGGSVLGSSFMTCSSCWMLCSCFFVILQSAWSRGLEEAIEHYFNLGIAAEIEIALL